MRLSKCRRRETEMKEIELLKAWIDFGKPDSGSNPLSRPPLPPDAPIGRISGNSFSRYDGCKKFSELPLSQKTKDALSESKFTKMTRIQRASLPHALCGRDIIGASKTGSGKSLAFIIPVLENLHRLRWGPEDGIGSIIISPTRELSYQLFEVLKSVGKNHSFSVGLLIGGRSDVEAEKEYVNELNILVCTPGRLLQHMDETPNFDCSQLQKALDAIISQLPKHRQTLLFSATLTNSIKGLRRVGLQDPEYLNVDQESVTATPDRLLQRAMIVPLDQKLDLLWSFIKAHLNSTILVFFSTCKQVKFAFEAFKKLRPGVPLACLYGRMKLERRIKIYSQFCLKHSVLFVTDVAERGLEFNKRVDWIVQVDCADDCKAYKHRVGRSGRNGSPGNSILFLMPSEIKMLEKLNGDKIPIQFKKSNPKRLRSISTMLAALLVRYDNLQQLAQRAFITYLKSVYIKKDKEIFDVMKLPIEDFAASLGLPMIPRIRFLKRKAISGKPSLQPEIGPKENLLEFQNERPILDSEDEVDDDILIPKETPHEGEAKTIQTGDVVLAAMASKKKHKKINIDRPTGTKTCLADTKSCNRSVQLDTDLVNRRYTKMKEEMKQRDKEDKLRDRLRRKEMKERMKRKRGRKEDTDSEYELSESDGEANKRTKFDNGVRDDKKLGVNADSITLAEQEKVALKLLSSMS